jgi:hypothetical protein
MRTFEKSLLTLCLLVVLCGAATASILRVGIGRDYPDIQPAVDAAMEGDVLLVDPGIYYYFRLTKGLSIRCSQPGNRFTVTQFEYPDIEIENLGQSSQACISGMKILPAQEYGGPGGRLWINACQGAVILENVAFEVEDIRAINTRIVIRDSPNVALVDVRATTEVTFSGQSATVFVRDSRVRISHSFIKAGQTVDDIDAYDSPGGLAVERSFVSLTETDVLGGHGSDCPRDGSGVGGDAITAVDSELVIQGSPDHVIRGGDGGDLTACGRPGGNGGVGFRGDSALVSVLPIKGGRGGPGSPDGNDGAPWVGSLRRLDVIPWIAVSSDLRPGTPLDVQLYALEDGIALLLSASETGFLFDKSKIGPPLSVLPGGFFLTVVVGYIDAPTKRAITIKVPDDPTLIGFAVHLQMAIVGASGVYHTNAISRVVGE